MLPGCRVLLPAVQPFSQAPQLATPSAQRRDARAICCLALCCSALGAHALRARSSVFRTACLNLCSLPRRAAARSSARPAGFFSLAAVACRSPPVCDASCPNSPALPSQIFAMLLSAAHLAAVEGGIFGKGLSVFCIARFAWSSVECGLVPNNPVSALFPAALSAPLSRFHAHGLCSMLIILLICRVLSLPAKRRAAEEAAAAAAQAEVQKDSKALQLFAMVMAFVCVLVGTIVMMGKSAKDKSATKALQDKAKQKAVEDKIAENNKKAASGDDKENKKVNPQPEVFDKSSMESNKKKVANAKRNNARGQAASFGGQPKKPGCYMYAHVSRNATCSHSDTTAQMHARRTMSATTLECARVQMLNHHHVPVHPDVCLVNGCREAAAHSSGGYRERSHIVHCSRCG
jgi:hypothetical protein